MLPEPITNLSGPFRYVIIVGLLTVTGAASVSAVWYAASKLFPPVSPEHVPMAYFYDQNSGELFEVPAYLDDPQETPTGAYRGMPAGVRAVVFSCGSCRDPEKLFVGWLEAPSHAVAAAGQTLPPHPPTDIEEYRHDSRLVIRKPDDDRWYFFASHEGERIVELATKRCDSGKAPRHCEPRARLIHEVDPKLLRKARESLTSATSK